MKHIVAVSSKKQLATFIDFPHELYKADPNYVPELFIAQRDLLSPTHPFHKHSSLQCFLLYEGERVIGRIAAILNNSHNIMNNTSDGFFGFFDCINDQESASFLLNTAAKWLEDKGAKEKMIGPVNFSTNESCGLLIQGFDMPPVVMMPYNASYYPALLEGWGLKKQVDLIAWRFNGDNYDDRSVKLMDRLEERLTRNNIVIRKINLKNFKQEAAALREVYNKAWDKNMGFVPLNDEEFDYQAKDLKLVLDPDFCLVAEQDGKLVGFGAAIPDMNQIQIKIKKGRLLPTGIFKLLFGKKKVKGIRILLLGVIDGYRKMGIEACIYGRIIKAYREKGMEYAEASWTLEHNELVNNAIIAIKGDPYKKYRIYERALSA
ncbi:GNAT superfamily N-acetyltransferase [Pedobacter africanus]|uniref:GNAT superfamily N-acetyltransferase n=1 Tax=Pedobacter africanus TaxID=151894 RepID=A0ACC6KS90_9SPHI|nr:GNAT family N-acetyltransferase [Pedobacter africanus]MDR6782218.1 GNAT superfamily N-acetyltransferase [Pedobacter africanus]